MEGRAGDVKERLMFGRREKVWSEGRCGGEKISVWGEEGGCGGGKFTCGGENRCVERVGIMEGKFWVKGNEGKVGYRWESG